MRMQACSEGDELERGEEQFISNGKLISTIRAFLSTQRPSVPLCFPCVIPHPDYNSSEAGLHQHSLCFPAVLCI